MAALRSFAKTGSQNSRVRGEQVTEEYAHPVIQKAPTVNYHMLKACNMSCGFCFASFSDTSGGAGLTRREALELVDMLSRSDFRKINFAGGEPTLSPWLPELIQLAKSHDLTTSIVTNGSHITPEWLDHLDGSLDIIALSIDSVDSETQGKIGRVERGKGPINAQGYLSLSEMITERGIRLKVNTVVSSANYPEDFRSFILGMKPERWKILQVLPVNGQNDDRIGEFTVTVAQFKQYVERNHSVERSGIVVVPETNALMTSSYVMVNPHGRFFDNSRGRHTYSRPILEVGVQAALHDVVVDTDRFERRGGNY